MKNLFAKIQGNFLVRSSVKILSAQWIGLVLRFTATLVTARMVGPEEIGYVAWMGIWPVYATWLTLGVPFGAGRLIPIRKGEERTEEVEEIKRAAVTVTLSVMGICVLAGGVVALAMTSATEAFRWKVAGAGVLCAATIFNNYVSMILVAEQKFQLISKKQIVEGLLWWTFVPLVLLGLQGLALRMLLVTLIVPFAFAFAGNCWRMPRFNRSMFASLGVEGRKIMVVSFFITLMFSFDRTLIAFFMDDAALGIYMIASLVISLVQPVTASIGRACYANFGEHFGRHKNSGALAKQAFKPIFIFSAAMVPFVVAGFFLARPLTNLLLPRYIDGVPSAQIALITALFAPMLGSYIYYIVVNQQKALILKLSTGLLVQGVVSVTLFMRNQTIESFAWGLVVGFAVSSLLLGSVGLRKSEAEPSADRPESPTDTE